MGSLVAMSYDPARSGDLIIIQKEYYIASNTGTTHGSPYDYDSRVPLIFWGSGVQAGELSTECHPRDAAPTVARLLGFDLFTEPVEGRGWGRVLSEIVRAP